MTSGTTLIPPLGTGTSNTGHDKKNRRRKYGDPSDGVDYYWAVNNAFLTSSNLATVVNSVPGEKVVMAHSLGAVAASSAFVDHGMVADKYFALNAAVASEGGGGKSSLMKRPLLNGFGNAFWKM